MDPSLFALVVVAGLISLIVTGFPVVIALGLCSFLGIAHLMQDYNIAGSLLASSAYGAIRSYVFATIPLFVLLGEIISRSGAASDLYRVIDTAMKRLPGRLALATVGGNTVFGAVTGVSIASAATFSRIAYPEMVRAQYNKSVALGSIAGSAALGMLIPPSILLIIWGVVASESIGRLFVAGIIPGILLATMFFLFLLILALVKPKLFGEDSQSVLDKSKAALDNPITGKMLFGCFLVIALIMVILGGIWTGFFTPTEAGGVGVLFAVMVGIIKGMRAKEFMQSVLNTGRVSAPLLFLLITAEMYSRMLAQGGIIDVVAGLFFGLGGDVYMILLIMVLVWLLLGMFLDSVSIILLTVPLFAPIAAQAGMNPLAFAIIGILAIEAGLLTPPFGMCVYTVKGAVSDPDVTLAKIFIGAIPYWLILLSLVGMVAFIPEIASWLPGKVL